MSKIDLSLPTYLNMVSAALPSLAPTDLQVGKIWQWWLPWRKQCWQRHRRQRQWCGGGGNRASVCTADTLAVGSEIREEVVTAAKKAGGSVNGGGRNKGSGGFGGGDSGNGVGRQQWQR